MNAAETILKMIEAVDPADTATMREIDERVFAFLNELDFILDNMSATKYTRSRDALCSIRPEGWYFAIFSTGVARAWKSKNDQPLETIGATEELAELHAIIQAIAYESRNDPTSP